MAPLMPQTASRLTAGVPWATWTTPSLQRPPQHQVLARRCFSSQTNRISPPPSEDNAVTLAHPPLLWRQRVAEFGTRHSLTLGLAVAVAVALVYPDPGCYVGSWTVGSVRVVQALNNAAVFFISGLTLKAAEVRNVRSYQTGFVYGALAILFLTPCLGLAAPLLPLTPPEFATGLAIFSAVPTTLGVGVALVTAVGGHQPLALLLTVVTNMAGIFTVPLVLQGILGAGAEVALNPFDLTGKLLVTVLLPTLLGAALSSHTPRVSGFVQRHRAALGLLSTANLMCIVWQTLSGARGVLLQQDLSAVLVVSAFALAQHFFYLGSNALVVGALRMPRKEAVATVIMASQKSAPVAVTVICFITPDLATQGLYAIPALCGQVLQILVGSALVGPFRRFVESGEAAPPQPSVGPQPPASRP
eukprot:GGOE01022249.1.p1 GENE.GGOE01022249.1~~GGOE01022249.1.p1  ORF type:complete len:449 (+),score=122.92 GGOE01022249.1:101-1348(+)